MPHEIDRLVDAADLVVSVLWLGGPFAQRFDLETRSYRSIFGPCATPAAEARWLSNAPGLRRLFDADVKAIIRGLE
jgi:hypothetical protein